ncbi:heparan-alpha-glucosaminide N-acetyltransferase domain-containing protein, partial [Arthrospira platensis SPKY1]|nr:heparan-alpha-glucosaminide N-acetyltransferase domain-containing protein [Arthrospira platensis SPKY1]
MDLLRAFAILMMLQGHFTDTLLDVAYRDPNNLIYSTWLFMRGLTAPVFFFASGLIFVFLLLRDGRPFRQNERMLKGLRRGLSLIVIG